MGPRAALAALVVLALTPAVAHGSVTIGSSLQTPSTYDNVSCLANPCTGTNLNLPQGNTASGGLTAPFSGVIVKWRVNSGSAGNPVALRVLRPVSGTTFTGAGTSETHTTQSGVSDFFPSRLRITQGDSIGLDISNSALVWSAHTGGATSLFWSSGLADGSSAAGSSAGDRELLVQAVVEPDADGDGYGDETQDACPQDPQRQAPPCGTPGGGNNGGGGGNNNGGGGTNTTPDTTPPVLSALAVSPNAVRLGRRAHITFRVSEPSRVTLTFTRLVPGRRRNGRCVAGARAGRRCTRLVRAATLTVRAQGRASLAFTGVVARRRLALGRYRVTARAVDLVGNAGRPRAATFTLRRAPARRHR